MLLMKKGNFAILSIFIFFALLFSNLDVKADSGSIKIINVNSEEFIEILQSSNKNNRVIFIFASWCPHCKNAMNNFIELQDKIEKNTDMFVLSLDKRDVLEKYIESIRLNGNNQLKFYLSKNIEETDEIFAKIDIKFRGILPQIVLLNRNNEIVNNDIRDLGQLVQIIDNKE